MKDKCVLCGEETTHKQDERINDRMNYVEGSGQLCDSCYTQVYIGAHNGNLEKFRYYTRHLNDGTNEIAAFCFLAALVCIIIAVIYKLIF